MAFYKRGDDLGTSYNELNRVSKHLALSGWRTKPF